MLGQHTVVAVCAFMVVDDSIGFVVLEMGLLMSSICALQNGHMLLSPYEGQIVICLANIYSNRVIFCRFLVAAKDTATLTKAE